MMMMMMMQRRRKRQLRCDTALRAVCTCPVCCHILLEPVTLACGHSCCQQCLQTLLHDCDAVTRPHCPAGCASPISRALPSPCIVLKRTLAAAFPPHLEGTNNEEEENEQETDDHQQAATQHPVTPACDKPLPPQLRIQALPTPPPPTPPPPLPPPPPHALGDISAASAVRTHVKVLNTTLAWLGVVTVCFLCTAWQPARRVATLVTGLVVDPPTMVMPCGTFLPAPQAATAAGTLTASSTSTFAVPPWHLTLAYGITAVLAILCAAPLHMHIATAAKAAYLQWCLRQGARRLQVLTGCITNKHSGANGGEEEEQQEHACQVSPCGLNATAVHQLKHCWSAMCTCGAASLVATIATLCACHAAA